MSGDILGASLMAQRVKNLPTMQEVQVRFLGREDSLKEEMAAHSSYSLGLAADTRLLGKTARL